ncbi:MAG: ATP-binding cassette, subfamily bacterial [Candidatus Dependentiae bacterium]|nr:ATP-binding cassette, subfamily bacterial [Candidatus Dependentiae bacterium]
MKPRSPLLTLLSHSTISTHTLLCAMLYSALNKICDIVPEILIGISIDIIVNQSHSLVANLTGVIDPFYQLYWVGALTALLWILESIFEYLYCITWSKLAHSIQHELRLKAYEALQNQDLAFFEQTSGGNLVATLHDDINQLRQFLSQFPNEAIQLFINIVVLGYMFFWLAPMIAFCTLIPIPFVLGIAYHFQHKLAALYDTVRTTSAAVASHISYRLHGITTIKSYTTEQYELTHLNTKSSHYKIANSHASQAQAQYIPIVRMAIMAGFIMALTLGGIYALQGKLPINWYAALVFLSQRFLWPFTAVSNMTDTYEQSAACAKRILTILESSPIIADAPTANPQLVIKNGTIDFSNVTFGYNTEAPLFNQLSFTIQPRTTVAFVGTTGSGKSSIIKLLLRFYQPTGGSITLGGYESTDLTLHALRSAIGFVSQEVYLVEGTIADNICYGSFDASEAAIIAAAKQAQAHDFITALPAGYDTVVQEHGKNLSGGQRQRIAIARAIIKKAPIIVLDEATSAVDNETEAAIGRAITELKKDHTIIIIAHRLTTVRNADTIYVLDHDAIVESGTHDTLLEKGGLYAKLCAHQAQ